MISFWGWIQTEVARGVMPFTIQFPFCRVCRLCFVYFRRCLPLQFASSPLHLGDVPWPSTGIWGDCLISAYLFSLVNSASSLRFSSSHPLPWPNKKNTEKHGHLKSARCCTNSQTATKLLKNPTARESVEVRDGLVFLQKIIRGNDFV